MPELRKARLGRSGVLPLRQVRRADQRHVPQQGEAEGEARADRPDQALARRHHDAYDQHQARGGHLRQQ